MILFSNYYLSFSFNLQYATTIPNQPTLAEYKKRKDQAGELHSIN